MMAHSPEKTHWAFKAVDAGACRSMTGDIHPCVVFLSTPDGEWDESSIAAYKGGVRTALDRLVTEAAAYGAALVFHPEFYQSRIETNVDMTTSKDFVFNALKNAGLPWERDTDHYSREQIPVLFLINAGGRSFSDHTPDQKIEYAVLFKDDEKVCCHELLHLYGAVDLYMYDAAAAFAKEHFADSLMFAYTKENHVDPLTAKLVGWTEDLSETAKAFLAATADMDPHSMSNDHHLSVFTGTRKEVKESITYSGPFLDGMYHGMGILRHANGELIVGSFAYGHYDGLRVSRLADGTIIAGYYAKGHPKGDSMTIFSGKSSSGLRLSYGSAAGQDGCCWSIKLKRNGTIHTGLQKDGACNGFGIKLDKTQGKLEIGQWKNDTLTYPRSVIRENINEENAKWIKGTVCTQLSDDEHRSGNGTQRFADGTIKSGSSGDLKMNELDFWYKPDGTFYTGKFAYDAYSGYGTKRFDNNEIYAGEWVNGAKQGYGVFRWADGKFYSGEFQHDGWHGYGCYSNIDGYMYCGQWVDSRQKGPGTAFFANGDMCVYRHVGSQTQEFTTSIYSDGDIQCGAFLNNNYSGIGMKCCAKDGTTYIGEFAASEYCGQGVMVWDDGSIYIGGFQKNKIYGEGYFITADNHIYKGFFTGRRKTGTYIHTLPTFEQRLEEWLHDVPCE